MWKGVYRQCTREGGVGEVLCARPHAVHPTHSMRLVGGGLGRKISVVVLLCFWQRIPPLRVSTRLQVFDDTLLLRHSSFLWWRTGLQWHMKYSTVLVVYIVWLRPTVKIRSFCTTFVLLGFRRFRPLEEVASSSGES